MNRSIVATAALAALVLSLPASAQFQKPEDAVKYRQSSMFVMANHFGRIGAMVNNRAPYDAGAAVANAEVVATLSRVHWVGFVDGTAGTTKGSASPKIWSERAKFDEAGKRMEGEVAKLLAAARTNSVDNLRPAFGAVGQTCKGCHDDFRNP
jgi:cytochrome c556